jgi:aminoglycoside phosphotransferase (APT) family kinase protein
VLAAIRSRIESASFHPTLYHGDFAPWNVKAQADGTWRVLDWERGEFVGMPSWDWFHYHVQVGLLVQRWDTPTHAHSLCSLLADRGFLRYADAAGVRSLLRDLLLAYLLYSMHILGPKESLPAKQALLDTLAAQWKCG